MTVPKVKLGFGLDRIPSITILPAGTSHIRIHKPWLEHNSIFILTFQSFFQKWENYSTQETGWTTWGFWRTQICTDVFFKTREGPHTPVHMGLLSRKKRESVVLAHISEGVLLSTCLDLRKGPPVPAQETGRAEKISSQQEKKLDKWQINGIFWTDKLQINDISWTETIKEWRLQINQLAQHLGRDRCLQGDPGFECWLVWGRHYQVSCQLVSRFN